MVGIIREAYLIEKISQRCAHATNHALQSAGWRDRQRRSAATDPRLCVQPWGQRVRCRRLDGERLLQISSSADEPHQQRNVTVADSSPRWSVQLRGDPPSRRCPLQRKRRAFQMLREADVADVWVEADLGAAAMTIFYLLSLSSTAGRACCMTLTLPVSSCAACFTIRPPRAVRSARGSAGKHEP